MNTIVKLDFKKAILLPFSGKDWFLRLIVLSVLSFPLTSGYCKSLNLNIDEVILIFFLLLVIFLGYFWQFAHNEINNISPSLPSWKLKFVKYFKQGLMCLIVLFSNLLFIGLLMGIIYMLVNTILILFVNSTISLLQIIHNNTYLRFLYNFAILISEIYLLFILFVAPCFYANTFKLFFKDRPQISLLKWFNIFSNAKGEFIFCIAGVFVSHLIVGLISNHIESLYMQIILTSLMLSIIYIVLFDLFIQAFILSKQRGIDLIAAKENK